MRKRSLFLVGIPILALVFVVALLFAVRSTAQPPPAPLDDISAASATAFAPAPAGLSTSAGTAARPPSVAPTVAPGVASAPAADADLVALVNGVALRRERLALAQAVDQVMARLLGAEAAAPGALLDQVINHALVTQQMGAPAPSIPLSETGAETGAEARLETLLGAAGRTDADLASALAAAAVERLTFDRYFAELLAADAFARQAAAAQGIDLDSYIGSLQSAARISYGPAGALSETALFPQAPATAPVTGVQPAAALSSTQMSAPAAGPPAPDALALDAPAIERGVSAGQLGPDFALDTLGESGQTTFDDLLGKPLVLSFWTTWCPYCLRQTPVLVAAAERYAGDIRFAGIDVAEEADLVAAYVAEHAIPYPVLLDRQSQAATAYAVNGFPTTYFLDATGHIVAQHIGSLSEEELTQYVEQLRRPRS